MQTDKLNGLIALKYVVEKKNFRAAAKTLGISPSGISQSIKQLEAKLGVTLLSRTTRSTGLTEAGEQFLAQAGPALEQIISAMDSVGSFGKKPTGLLRINLPRAVYCSFLPKQVESFLKKFPAVTVELFFEDSFADLSKDGFDAGIRISEVLNKDMVAIKISDDLKYVAAASPKYLTKMGRPRHPKDLINHNCLVQRFGNSALYDRWEFKQSDKVFQVHVRGSVIMNDSNFLLNSALRGTGIIYAAEDSITEYLKSGKLEVVLEQYANTSKGYYLYYPRRSQVLPKLRAFIDYLKEENRS